MVVVQLDEDDLDEEDLAILAEVKKKGYYHGRPKTVTCEAPQKVADLAEGGISSSKVDRREYDSFQKKWDCFDNEEFLLKHVEQPIGKQHETQEAGPAQTLPEVVHTFRIILVGDGGVGKTSFMQRHQTGMFTSEWVPSASMQTHSLKFRTNCGVLIFSVIDANGSSWDSTVGYPTTCPDVDAAIYMFDVTKPLTYHSLQMWYAYVCTSCENMPSVLIGNKIDSPEKYKSASVVTFHKSLHMPYYEVSLLRLLNFARPFLWLARKLTNQPCLEFVGPRAVTPPFSVDPALFREHEQKLAEACSKSASLAEI